MLKLSLHSALTRSVISRLRLIPCVSLLALVCVAAPSAYAGIIIVASIGESKALLLDGDTYKLIAELPTGAGPHEIRVSPDKRYAYVAISGTGPQGVKGKTVTVIDLRQRKVKTTFDLGTYAQPHDVRVSRDGRRIWVACAPAKAVLEMDANSGKILKTYNTNQDGSWFVEVTPDERKLYTPNLEGKSVSVIDRRSGAVKIIPFTEPVYGIDITPDGRQVWVTGRGVTVIDTATDEVIARIETPEADAGRIRLTPDGRRAVVALSNRVLLFDVKTRRLMNEIPVGARPKVLAVSADSRRAFLTNPGDNAVTVIDLAAGKQVATFATSKAPDGIAWVD